MFDFSIRTTTNLLKAGYRFTFFYQHWNALNHNSYRRSWLFPHLFTFAGDFTLVQLPESTNSDSVNHKEATQCILVTGQGEEDLWSSNWTPARRPGLSNLQTADLLGFLQRAMFHVYSEKSPPKKRKQQKYQANVKTKASCWCQRSDDHGQTGFRSYSSYRSWNSHSLQQRNAK